MPTTSTFAAQKKASRSDIANYTTARAIQGTTTAGKYYGYLYFPDLASGALKNVEITSITLITSCTSGAGYGNWATKVLGIYAVAAAYQKPVASAGDIANANYREVQLGNYSGTDFYSASNVRRPITGDLYTSMKKYLEAGNCALSLYKGDSTPSSPIYSANYLYLDGCSLEVVYGQAPVQVASGGSFNPAAVYYGVGGIYKECAPYYATGGTWNKV